MMTKRKKKGGMKNFAKRLEQIRGKQKPDTKRKRGEFFDIDAEDRYDR